MRVLTFLHSFEPGGVERVALRLVARWRAMGVDAPLFMGRVDGPLRGEVAAGLDFDVPVQPRLGSGWWETLWMVLMLPGHVRRVRPDVLFCAGSTYTVVAVAMKLLLGRACPPIVAKISNDLARTDLPALARAPWRWWLRIQARFVDRWVVMDDSMLADVAALLGPVARDVVADPAIDRLPALTRREGRGAGTRFVAVGRLAGQKDHATMLAAFAAVASTHDRLTLMGDGPLRARLERQAARLGIAGRMTFAGHLPDAAGRMRDHDVLLLSSRYEGVPAVLVEALAVGMRIVSTDCGPGVRSMLDRGHLARVVPPGDPGAFAAAMIEARTMRVDPHEARASAGRFTLDGSAARYLAAFRRAIATSAAPRATDPLLLEPAE